MKLNKEALKQIIKEELEAVLDESQLLDRYSKNKEEEKLFNIDAEIKTLLESLNKKEDTNETE